MHSMPYDRCVFVEQHIHNYHYLAMHLHHMTPSVLATNTVHINMSAGRATTHWDNFRSLATDASNEYDIMLCVCMIHPHTVGFSLQSQVGRWLILCAPAVCSWSTENDQLTKLSSRTQQQLRQVHHTQGAVAGWCRPTNCA